MATQYKVIEYKTIEGFEKALNHKNEWIEGVQNPVWHESWYHEKIMMEIRPGGPGGRAVYTVVWCNDG